MGINSVVPIWCWLNLVPPPPPYKGGLGSPSLVKAHRGHMPAQRRREEGGILEEVAWADGWHMDGPEAKGQDSGTLVTYQGQSPGLFAFALSSAKALGSPGMCPTLGRTSDQALAPPCPLAFACAPTLPLW